MKGMSLLFLLLSICFRTHGQECLITSPGPAYNYVFTSPGMNVITGGYAMYNTSPSSYSECGWTPIMITGKSCGVCTSLGICVAGVCSCVGNLYIGYEASSFTIINCNLDDYAWAIALATGTFSLFAIKNRR